MYQGRPQSLIFPPDHPDFPDLPKGARAVAEERGFPVEGKKLEEVIAFLKSCEDFHAEKTQLEKKHKENCQIAMFLPKFHCEFNAAEHVWAISKQWCRANCKGNVKALEEAIRQSFKEISKPTYLKIYQHAMEEIVSSSESDVKKRLKVYKSHRQVQAIPWDHILEVEEEERSE